MNPISISVYVNIWLVTTYCHLKPYWWKNAACPAHWPHVDTSESGGDGQVLGAPADSPGLSDPATHLTCRVPLVLQPLAGHVHRGGPIAIQLLLRETGDDFFVKTSIVVCEGAALKREQAAFAGGFSPPLPPDSLDLIGWDGSTPMVQRPPSRPSLGRPVQGLC